MGGFIMKAIKTSRPLTFMDPVQGPVPDMYSLS